MSSPQAAPQPAPERVTESASDIATEIAAKQQPELQPIDLDLLTVRTIDRGEDFARLEQAWQGLLMRSRTNSVFLSWEWLFSWWQHFGEGHELAIKLIDYHGELIGIAPLFIENARVQGLLSMRILQWLGIGAVGSDYLDLIAAPGYEHLVAQALCQQLIREQSHWDLMRLSEILHDSPTLTDLRAQFDGNNFEYLAGREYTCPYIDLRGQSWESYQESLSSNMRYNLRRRAKQVFNQQKAQLHYCERAEDVAQFLGEIFALHNKRWIERGGSDGFDGEQVQAFHNTVAARLFARDYLRLYLLKIEDKAVAGIYGIEYGDTFSFYQSGFDPAFDRFSVGMVLMGETIKNAIARRCSIYDFLHGVEEYKFKWTQLVRQTVTLQFYSRRKLKPRLFFWLKALKNSSR